MHTKLTSIYKTRPALKLLILLLTLTPPMAFAHSAQLAINDWTDGFSHPFQGWDHLLAMLAVGIWAAQLGGYNLWRLPLTFISIMSCGALVGTKGLALQNAEPVIMLSGIVLSILAAGKIRFDIKLTMLIVAFFAFFHGYAHGVETTASVNFYAYALGFVLSTALLHCLGILFHSNLIKVLNRKVSTTLSK